MTAVPRIAFAGSCCRHSPSTKRHLAKPLHREAPDLASMRLGRIRKGGRDGNYISATPSCGDTRTSRLPVRTGQDRAAIEAEGLDGVLGLRRNVVVRRGTRIPV